MLRAFFKFSSRVDGSEQCSVGARPETSQESQILATQVVHLDADTFLPLTIREVHPKCALLPVSPSTSTVDVQAGA